ncbi:MAG TPA: Fe-S protein assembly co-chaperone HscB [Polyangiales bacterium]
MDAFDVLGLPPSLELDPASLEQRYRELQRQLHPDKFVQASSSERRASLARAVTVNDAYRTLKDELKRAEVLFARFSGRKAQGEQATAEPELLMEMMELREELSGVRKRGDVDRAGELRRQVTALQASALATLRSAFASTPDARNDGLRHKAEQALMRLRYYKRFQDEVVAFEDDIDAD